MHATKALFAKLSYLQRKHHIQTKANREFSRCQLNSPTRRGSLLFFLSKQKSFICGMRVLPLTDKEKFHGIAAKLEGNERRERVALMTQSLKSVNK